MPNLYFFQIAGQSNAEGPLAGKFPDLGPNVLYTQGGREGYEDRMGLEAGFVRTLRNNGFTDLIAVDKFAYGGTSVAQDSGVIDWSPSSRGELYDQWVGHTKGVLADYGTNYSVQVVTGLWDQGEGDAHTVAEANAYRTLQPAMMHQFATDVGVPIKFAIDEILVNPTYPDGTARMQQVQHDIASAEGLRIFESDGLEVRDGKNHVAHSGYYAKGEAAAYAFMSEIGFTPTHAVSDVFGTAGADTLTGTADGRWVFGLQGDDRIQGLDADDRIFGGNDDDLCLGGNGADYVNGEWGNDALFGDAGDDSLFGDYGDDKLLGGAGADYLDGGEGTDTVSYQAATAAVTINLGAQAGYAGEAAGDVLIGFEKAMGTNFSDTLVGSQYANTIEGLGGNDLIAGGLGADVLSGGAGKDTFFFNVALNGTVDHVTDFNAADDSFRLENSFFRSLDAPGVRSDEFKDITGGVKSDANDYVLYNRANGVLYYDADGYGGKAAQPFAIVDDKVLLTYKDFLVV